MEVPSVVALILIALFTLLLIYTMYKLIYPTCPYKTSWTKWMSNIFQNDL